MFGAPLHLSFRTPSCVSDLHAVRARHVVDRIRVGNLAVAATDVGAGPPVVLLHGLACGKRMWFHQVRALRTRFRVVTYDLRGHGQTDAPQLATDYSAAHLARDLVGVLDALDIKQAGIVGFSLR